MGAEVSRTTFSNLKLAPLTQNWKTGY